MAAPSPPSPPLKHRIWWRLYDFEVGGGLWPANRGIEISPIHPRTRGFWEYETRFTTIVTKALAFWLWSKGSIRIFRVTFNFFFFFFRLINISGEGMRFQLLELMFLSFRFIFYLLYSCEFVIYFVHLVGWIFFSKEKFILINTGVKELFSKRMKLLGIKKYEVI